MFKDFLGEIKGFKYQITLKNLLSKYKENTDRELAPLYFNSTTKTVINCNYMLDKSFQETFKRTDNCISKESGWIIQSVDAEYVNVSIYSPLSGSSSIQSPFKLRNSIKGLINIKTNDSKCFV